MGKAKKRPDRKPSDDFVRWHLAVLIGLCIVVYWNSLSGTFVWDDEVQIVRNGQLRDLTNIPSAFTSAFWSFAFTSPIQTNFYRPVQTVAYMIAYHFGGLNPGPYHSISLAFHIAAAVFVYLILGQLSFSRTAALFGSALFATHPIHTEAVSWIAGLPDVACGAFYFATIYTFLRFVSSGKRAWLGLACLLFLFALFSKEMAVTLPLVAVFILRLREPDRQFDFGRIVRLIAPLVTVMFAYLVVRYVALGLIATSQNQMTATAFDWVTLGFRVFGQYLLLGFLPYRQNAFPLVAIHISDRIGMTLLSFAAVASITVGLVYLRKKAPEFLLWFCMFAVMLVPVFYFKGISATLLAERYLYIPSLACVAICACLFQRSRSSRLSSALWIIVLVFGGLTVLRNPVWNNSERLYTSTLEIEPDAAQMRINLADIWLKRGQDTTVREQLDLALQSMDKSKYVQLPYDQYRAYVGMGALEARAQKYDQAVGHLKKALEINPDGDWAYTYLGGVYWEGAGDYAKATEYLKKAIQLSPLNEVSRDYLGVILLNRKNYEEAVKYFEEALRINPTYEDAKNHLTIAQRARVP